MLLKAILKPIKMEKVSIITPTFNSEKYISETIRSVQNQSHKNWEMIIVDDGSTDNTKAIVSDFALNDSRIKLFELHQNSGAGVARNFALSKTSGRYITFLDADDLWQPEKLAKQIDFLKSNNLHFTFCFYDCIDENGIPLNKRIEAPITLSYRQLFFCNFVGNLTGIYDANYFGKIPISSIRKRQDWMMWLVILKKIEIAHPLPKSLASYRIRKGSISASKLDLLAHNFAVYHQFHRLNKVVSALCMMGFLFTQLIVKPFYIKKLKK